MTTVMMEKMMVEDDVGDHDDDGDDDDDDGDDDDNDNDDDDDDDDDYDDDDDDDDDDDGDDDNDENDYDYETTLHPMGQFDLNWYLRCCQCTTTYQMKYINLDLKQNISICLYRCIIPETKILSNDFRVNPVLRSGKILLSKKIHTKIGYNGCAIWTNYQ